MIEIWKPYPSNPKYQVSNLGGVRDPQGIYKPFQIAGRDAVNIYDVNREKHYIFYIHRMVLETFVGPCPDGLEACHSDGNKANNSIDNLRWDTRLANKQDAIKHGAQAKGERINTAKLTEEQVREIRKRYAGGGITLEELASRYSVTDSNIHCIVSMKTWTHIK